MPGTQRKPAMPLRAAIFTAAIFCLLMLLAAIVTGPYDASRGELTDGLTLQPGQTAGLPAPPGSWGMARLSLRFAPKPPQTPILAAAAPGARPAGPYAQDGQKAHYLLRADDPAGLRPVLQNPGSDAVEVRQIGLSNFVARNSGVPRFAVMLQSPGPLRPWPWAGLGLGLACLLLQTPGLWLWARRGSLALGNWRPWVMLAAPLAVAAAAGILPLFGLSLLLSWDALLIIAALGPLIVCSPYLLPEPAWVAVVALSGFTGYFLLTVLGVGQPTSDFGPPLLHLPFMTKPALAGLGLWVICLAVLAWRRPAWLRAAQRPLVSTLALVVTPCLFYYTLSGWNIFGGDTLFNSLVAWRILEGKGLLFNDIAEELGHWGLVAAPGGWAQVFPIGPGLLTLPLALLQKAMGATGTMEIMSCLQKTSAALIAAISAGVCFRLMMLVLRRQGWALVLTAAFALSATQAGISASIIWQHGPAVLLILLALCALVRGMNEDRAALLALAALPLALLPIIRPQAMLLYLAAGAACALLRPRSLIGFALWSLPGALASLAVNLGVYGSLLGGYSNQAGSNVFSTPLAQGLAGVLFSPSRGLFVFLPVAVMGLAGLLLAKGRRRRLAWPLLIGAALFVVLHAKYYLWTGGDCIAPRFVSELLPIFMLGAAWLLDRYRGRALAFGAGALCGLTVLIGIPPALFPHETDHWNPHPGLNWRNGQLWQRVWDTSQWMPLQFRHYLDLQANRPAQAWAFAEGRNQYPDGLAARYAVARELGPDLDTVLRMPSVRLRKGHWLMKVEGDFSGATGMAARLKCRDFGMGLLPEHVQARRMDDGMLVFELPLPARGWADLELQLGGQGRAVLETVILEPDGG